METSQTEVFVYNTSPTTLKKDVERILEKNRLTKYYDAKERTLIKINANYDRNYPGCNTSTWFLDALLTALKQLGFIDLVVIESDLKLQPAEKTICVIGIDRVLEKHGVPFINIERYERGEDEIPLFVHKFQMINVPVIHTHTFAVMSCATKNLFGLLPVYREKYHWNLSDKLLEIAQSVNPCFTIVDGTVGLEGGSMRMGNPKRLDLILAGWNPLSIDKVVTKIMGFSLETIPVLQLATRKDVICDVIVKGDYETDSLLNFDFVYKPSKIASIDIGLRKNSVTKGLFKYNSFFDRLAHRVRRLLLSINYRLKKESLFKGPWMEYYEESN
jgi:uncharacterized protein (DUF362 family)